MAPVLRWPDSGKFPVLETERLLLRAPAPDDAGLVFALYSAEAVMRYRGAPVFTTINEAEELISQWQKLFEEQKGIRWIIVLKQSGRACGTAGLKSVSAEHFRAETSYEIIPDRWNKGIMTEALDAALGWSFGELGLHSVEANISEENKASKRVLEKLGFVHEALFRQNWWFNGWWDSSIYSKINSRTTF